MRESNVEKHLRLAVARAGGASYKFKSPGRPHVPDRIVIWPEPHPTARPAATRIHFVECKAPGKKPRPGQAREHVRLRKLGCVILVLDTTKDIDAYVAGSRRV